ncbi:glycoside hydrolase family 5 protein [Candidatus Bathyarchaeota archaeon]|nr:glycoside hydrolase family 5 protein [Candidatus Bathyarchaeota archaeon]
MREKHFRLISNAGFNSVRIALHPFRDEAITREYKLSDGWLEVLDWAIEQSLDNELMAILDFHEFIAMGRAPLENRERFLSFWRQIGERYHDYPDEVLFELLNEPNGKLTPELWNVFLKEALSIVREGNPERIVIIGPAYWNNINLLSKLALPEEDRNIIVTVHYYEPMDFTHQGAKWAGREDKIGVDWKGTDEEKKTIIDAFNKAHSWAKEHNRPIFLGEFGVYDKAPMESRVRYLSFIARLAEDMGWSWAYWQFDSDFILYDIPNNRWIEPVLNALIPPE